MPRLPQNDQVVVHVDALGTNGYLAPALFACGIRSVHVSSGAGTMAYLKRTHNPAYYVADIDHPGDVDALLRLLAPFRVTHVLAGMESGVELAAELATRLDLPTRDDEKLCRARHNKVAMLDALADAGLMVRQRCEVGSAEQAVKWSSAVDSWPLVVKPTSSAGTDGMRVCANLDEVDQAVTNLLGHPDYFGLVNETALVEEFLPGQEYMVNTVSTGGWHRVVEIWRVTKCRQAGAQVYDFFELVDQDSADGIRVADPVNAILDALGFRWGPGHLELMDTPHGVELVEANARLHGGVDLSAAMAATGTNHVAETVRSLASPDIYRATATTAAKLSRACCSVILRSSKTGVLTRQPDWDDLRTLGTYHSMKVRWAPDQVNIPQTSNLFTAAGNVYLVGDPAEVAADRERARAWAAEHIDVCIEPHEGGQAQ